MKTLQDRLHIKAGMISLGERITWGSDSAIMQEVAEALTAKDAEIERLKKVIKNTLKALTGLEDHESEKWAGWEPWIGPPGKALDAAIAAMTKETNP